MSLSISGKLLQLIVPIIAINEPDGRLRLVDEVDAALRIVDPLEHPTYMLYLSLLKLDLVINTVHNFSASPAIYPLFSSLVLQLSGIDSMPRYAPEIAPVMAPIVSVSPPRLIAPRIARAKESG